VMERFQRKKERVMRTKMMTLVLVSSLVVTPSVVFAASPWMAETAYSEKIGGKFTFGLTNTLLGWTQLFSEPIRYQNDDKNVWSGMGKGLVDSIANTAGGVFHLSTFVIPVDFPLPDNGVPIEGVSEPFKT